MHVGHDVSCGIVPGSVLRQNIAMRQMRPDWWSQWLAEGSVCRGGASLVILDQIAVGATNRPGGGEK